MSTDRTVALWEDPYDLAKLSANGLNFCIAKAVADSSGTPVYNIVFQSMALQPRTTVTWTVQYGLNWTLKVPTANAQVTAGGIWQPCNPGEVYDLDKLGLFQRSTIDPVKGFLKLGKNGYQYEGTSGIHMLVGVKLPQGHFEPIFIDTTELAPNMSAWYQPRENVEWWYQKNIRSSTIIGGVSSNKCHYDLTAVNPTTNTHYVATNYKYDLGTWSISHGQPPQASYTGLLSAQRKRISGPPDDVDDNDLEQIRKDVKAIMYTLSKISGKDNVNGNVGSVDEI